MDKTLGQIAFEGGRRGPFPHPWGSLDQSQRATWEAIAVAVAAAVKEEDARICDRLAHNAKSAQSGPTDDLTNVMLRHHMVASQNCAIDIRASIKS